jgi:hypothetical protein
MSIKPFAAPGSSGLLVPSIRQLIVETLSVQVDVPGDRGVSVPTGSKGRQRLESSSGQSMEASWQSCLPRRQLRAWPGPRAADRGAGREDIGRRRSRHGLPRSPRQARRPAGQLSAWFRRPRIFGGLRLTLENPVGFPRARANNQPIYVCRRSWQSSAFSVMASWAGTTGWMPPSRLANP